MRGCDSRQKGSLALFGSAHEDGEDEKRGREHFDGETLSDVHFSGEGIGCGEVTDSDALGDSGGSDSTEDLSDGYTDSATEGETADKVETERHSWVEGTADRETRESADCIGIVRR